VSISSSRVLCGCIDSDTLRDMKRITFLGDSLARLRDFPTDARSEAGYQLSEIQNGRDPDDWKPMKTVGPGVREIRIREESGAFRVIYMATMADCVLVLHAFQKKAQQTPQKDIDLAIRRLRDWKG
jgi:phage-related protein